MAQFTTSEMISYIDGYGASRWPTLWASQTSTTKAAILAACKAVYDADGYLADVGAALDALEAAA